MKMHPLKLKVTKLSIEHVAKNHIQWISTCRIFIFLELQQHASREMVMCTLNERIHELLNAIRNKRARKQEHTE